MKTAQERARDYLNKHGIATSAGRLTQLERLFKEYARDQRYACVEALNDAYLEAGEDQGDTVDAQAVVQNTPAPGEGPRA